MIESDLHETRKWLNDLAHLSSGVGHHVINAFSAVVSNAELIRLRMTMQVPADPSQLADTIIKTALSASGVARRLIDYTRPITTIGEELLDVNALIEEFVAAEQEDGPVGVEWQTSLQPVPMVRGNRETCLAMLRHLSLNAYEAMRGHECHVTLRTSVDGRGWVVLELADDGVGMPGEVLERAVEPFFSTKPAHLGVGLSIANGIWRRHKGTLAIRSQPGEGTTVRLCIEGVGKT